MIHIKKKETPQFLEEYIRKNPSACYDSESFKGYYQELRCELIKEQKGLCAYCCTRIDLEYSHNEHIEPRHRKDGTVSKRSLDYWNIVASCNTASTCGIHKGNEYDEKRFVSPLSEDCERLFSYDPDGYMNGDEYTISLLNLNSYRLKEARRAVFKVLVTMSEEDIRQVFCCDSENYYQFSNVIFWYLRRIAENGSKQ